MGVGHVVHLDLFEQHAYSHPGTALLVFNEDELASLRLGDVAEKSAPALLVFFVLRCGRSRSGEGGCA